MSGGFPDGVTQAILDRAIGTDMTIDEENELQRRCEEIAEDEITEQKPRFIEWMRETGYEQVESLVHAAVTWPDVPGGIRDRSEAWQDNVSEATARLRDDYIQCRASHDDLRQRVWADMVSEQQDSYTEDR